MLVFSGVLSVVEYWWVTSFVEKPLQNLALTQTYALTAATYLYFAILAGPLSFTFKWIPFRWHYIKARRAIGVSTFYFALLHAYRGFYGEIGGFSGVVNQPVFYIIAITLSSIALFILFLMAATSFDYMVSKLTFPLWKKLHRFVYIASIFVLIHALLIGSHFRDLKGPIPIIAFIAILFLLLLEFLRITAFLKKQ